MHIGRHRLDGSSYVLSGGRINICVCGEESTWEVVVFTVKADA